MMLGLGVYEIVVIWISSGVLARIIFWWLDNREDDVTLSQLIWFSIFGCVTLLFALLGVVYKTCSSNIVVFKGKSK